MDSSGSSSSPSQSPIELPSRSTRSSISEHTRRRRSKDDRNHFTSSMRDVARVLVARERETMDLKRALYTLTEQLKAERQRADAAENKTREVLAFFKSANEAKLAAEQESARANEGLRMYKLQYDNAQAEIRRAQKLLDGLEAQRVDAEEAAAKARSTARKLKEEKIVMHAREEGRRQGLHEGLVQGRALGYEEGRTVGYEHGRAVSERAYPSTPATEMEYEEPRAREYDQPRVSRPSTSEDSEHDIRPHPNYTQALDDNLPNPPPLTTPTRIPTPATAPVIPPHEDQHRRPQIVHNAVLSPSHPATDVPPDGWIPSMDDDHRIRIPPPHEMAPPPPSPSPPLSAVLNNVRSIPEEPVMIPPPANDQSDMHNRRPKHRRRNSVESQSTTMSQFDILGPPSVPSTLRSTNRERPNILSAIAEERERTSSASSPVYGLPNLSTPSFQMPTPAVMPVPAPHLQSQTPSVPPPQNPSYPDIPRYQSTENLSRTASRTASRAASRAGSANEYYSANTPRYGGAEDSYRSAGPDTTPRYTRPDEPRRDAGAYGMYAAPSSTPRSAAPSSVHRQPSREDMYAAPANTPRSSAPSSVQRQPSREEMYNIPNVAPRSIAPSSADRHPRENISHPQQHIYAPPHSPHSSPDTPTPAIAAPMPSLRVPPPSQPTPENRGSMSSNEISFTVVPPSRPESNISRTDNAEPRHLFLSAEDADRPLPAVPGESEPPQPAVHPNPVIPPTVMMSGSWPPPGFVPTGPPSPIQSGGSTGPAGVPLPPSTYGGSTVGPVGIPLPPSVYGGTPSVHSEVSIPGGFPGSERAPPVIPLQPSSRISQSGSSRNTKEPYTRSAVKRHEDDSNSSVSSGLGSADSLTTPPARARKLSGRVTPSYAPAPVPANVVYPVSTPRSTSSTSLASHTTTAARMPLPPSVSGSMSGSVVGSVVGGLPPARSGSVIGGGRPPSEMSMPRSPMMGGGRNMNIMASPRSPHMALPTLDALIPIPIPEPTPITQPVSMPMSPARPMTPLADIDMDYRTIVPSVARAPSPVASNVTATTNVTTTTKGGKKGRKKK